jgi:hypothetical protein
MSGSGLQIRISEMNIPTKVLKKTKGKESYSLPFVCHDASRPILTVCDSARLKRSICGDLLHDVHSKRGGRWKLTFSHGIRACFFFFCSKVEMFFSYRNYYYFNFQLGDKTLKSRLIHLPYFP